MSASEPALPTLDPRKIRELRALGAELEEDVLSSVAAAFERTARGLVRMLAHALQAEDLARLSRLAHTLRSASAKVGAARLADLARCLEHDANASAPGVATLVCACTRELDEVRQVLAKLTEHEA